MFDTSVHKPVYQQVSTAVTQENPVTSSCCTTSQADVRACAFSLRSRGHFQRPLCLLRTTSAAVRSPSPGLAAKGKNQRHTRSRWRRLSVNTKRRLFGNLRFVFTLCSSFVIHCLAGRLLFGGGAVRLHLACLLPRLFCAQCL